MSPSNLPFFLTAISITIGAALIFNQSAQSSDILSLLPLDQLAIYIISFNCFQKNRLTYDMGSFERGKAVDHMEKDMNHELFTSWYYIYKTN